MKVASQPYKRALWGPGSPWTFAWPPQLSCQHAAYHAYVYISSNIFMIIRQFKQNFVGKNLGNLSCAQSPATAASCSARGHSHAAIIEQPVSQVHSGWVGSVGVSISAKVSSKGLWPPKNTARMPWWSNCFTISLPKSVKQVPLAPKQYCTHALMIQLLYDFFARKQLMNTSNEYGGEYV